MRETHTCVAPTRSHTKHETRDTLQTQNTRHMTRAQTTHATRTTHSKPHTLHELLPTIGPEAWHKAMRSDARIGAMHLLSMD